MGTCRLCAGPSRTIPQNPGLCPDCIRSDIRAPKLLAQVHALTRTAYGLPGSPPNNEGGVLCRMCINRCVLGEGHMGLCGVRKNEGNKIIGGVLKANVEWYYDPLPTNCCADWVCAGGTGAGYPRFAHGKGPENGYQNLAVFYQACNFDCLFCQNWHYKHFLKKEPSVSIEKLAKAVDSRTSCICFFGGDPGPQMVHSIKSARLAVKNRPSSILRICWETNGAMSAPLMRSAAKIALESGGCIKIDLKAWDDKMHQALTGVTNRQTIANIEMLARLIPERPEPPLLIVSTLLVPGYVDDTEVSGIARFLAGLNRDIPYTMLAFSPQFVMNDMPTTSSAQARRCMAAAKMAGLNRVRIGNIHLLDRIG